MTTRQWLRQNTQKIEIIPVPSRPQIEMNAWNKDASHYAVYVNSVFVSFYSRGSAHKGEPKAEEALECLRSDARCAYGDFDEFCADLGYNPDSRHDFAMFESMKTVRDNLKAALGNAFESFMETEE